MLDVERVRTQFPALAMTLDDGRPCIFLDNPAGTQVPRRVVDAMATYLLTSNANTGGAFLTSRRSDATIGEARRAMADFLGASDPDCIIFGANMTTLTFAISRAIGRDLAPGDEILCTVLDHDANIAPWLALEVERGVRVRLADMHPDDGTLDLADLQRKLSSRTRLVAVTYASNALGTINDVARITTLAHDAGALVWIDAVHFAPHGLIDLSALDCDFLACSAYKFFGPHVGIVYGKREHLERLRPYKVRPGEDVTPSRWEMGTLNHEGLAGVMNAV
ncbi:MAG TPA: cysteine desulfurase-like protein, partial [Chloroflexota bacterium]|nr:cysteine desulfurase-like protein [Chloroflexota bacterium]